MAVVLSNRKAVLVNSTVLKATLFWIEQKQEEYCITMAFYFIIDSILMLLLLPSPLLCAFLSCYCCCRCCCVRCFSVVVVAVWVALLLLLLLLLSPCELLSCCCCCCCCCFYCYHHHCLCRSLFLFSCHSFLFVWFSIEEKRLILWAELYLYWIWQDAHQNVYILIVHVSVRWMPSFFIVEK